MKRSSETIEALLQRRSRVREALRALKKGSEHRALSVTLRRIKGRLYYHRHRSASALSASQRARHYHEKRLRFLTRRLRTLQALPDGQPVSLSCTAGELRSRLEAKIACHARYVRH